MTFSDLLRGSVRRCVAALPLLLALPMSATADGLAFLDIGALDGETPATTSIVAVSGDGQTFVGISGSRGFRWHAGVMTDLGAGVSPAAVDHDGSNIVGTSAATQHAFLWNVTSGMHDLGVLPVFPQPTTATAISADGTTVVGFALASGESAAHAWIWTSATGMQDIGALSGSSSSAASGISGDGSIVVGASNAHAFRWTAVDGMVDITPNLLENGIAGASAISADGSTVVGGYNNTPGAPHVASRWFSWDAQTGLHDLLWPPQPTTPGRPTAVSADGSRIVGFVIDWLVYAVLWTPQTETVDLNVYLPSRGLDTRLWNLQTTTSISADGDVIAGSGLHSEISGSVYRYWIVTGLNSTETIFASTFDPHF